MFGTHFSVELHSAWRTNKLEDMKQDSLAEEFISTESPEDVSEDVSEDTESPEEETNETEETDNMDGDSEIISQDDKDDEENKEK